MNIDNDLMSRDLSASEWPEHMEEEMEMEGAVIRARRRLRERQWMDLRGNL